LDFIDRQSAGADKAHVSLENIPKLREFIHGAGAQKPAYPRNSRILVTRLNRTFLFGAFPHGSKFQSRESAFPLPPAALTKKNRPAVLGHDCSRHGQPNGRRYDQARTGKENIEATLQCFLDP
jgi:hypothetical protein